MICAESGMALKDLKANICSRKVYPGLVTTYATDTTRANDLSMCLLV